VTPLTEQASAHDARWGVAFLALAHGLVLAGAKAKIIERFTSLPHRQVSAIYKALRGTPPPSGPVVQGSARYFAVPNKDTSAAWTIQCAIFLACFERLGIVTNTPLQRGWRLLAAFRSYISLTDKLCEAIPTKRLDVNQAYALLTFCGFMAHKNGVELQRNQCPVCSINYPVVVSERLDKQGCPVCAINANCLRLAHQASIAASEPRIRKRR
jgi:hypothetical protein